ncbi:hypothetical protein PVAP13_9KG532100 [Panicum virgatum]|uniref:Uncharacterized protein n=1 Tax=Panicum virgatum TaxID=38727 RepID=A0A8T0NZW6_PANVG|nr:hypothetical protein PVAP13_9KG532100 [Panicum virgatum]
MEKETQGRADRTNPASEAKGEGTEKNGNDNEGRSVTINVVDKNVWPSAETILSRPRLMGEADTPTNNSRCHIMSPKDNK